MANVKVNMTDVKLFVTVYDAMVQCGAFRAFYPPSLAIECASQPKRNPQPEPRRPPFAKIALPPPPPSKRARQNDDS